jgi:hypothetical protein
LTTPVTVRSPSAISTLFPRAPAASPLARSPEGGKILGHVGHLSREENWAIWAMNSCPHGGGWILVGELGDEYLDEVVLSQFCEGTFPWAIALLKESTCMRTMDCSCEFRVALSSIPESS